MDALADLLDGVRARSAVFCRTELVPPWSLRIADEAPLGLVSPLRGEAWIVCADHEPLHLATGDIGVVTGGEPFTIAAEPNLIPQVVVHRGNRLTTPDGEPAELPAAAGEPDDDAAELASGTYQLPGDVGAQLLAALPRQLRVPGQDVEPHVTALLAAELAQLRPGQQMALDRLLDLVLVTTLRSWFARPEAQAPGWYRALGDPVVGPVLRKIHQDPAQSWTVESLASAAGVSRAVFARRFRQLVGESPLRYVTQWRLTLAADLLQQTDRTVEAIARQVGYANGFALSAAFTRVRGLSPRQYRQSCADRRARAAVTAA